MRRASGGGPESPLPRAALRVSAAETVLLACAAGLVTGSLHALVILTMRFGFGRLVFYSRDFIWMAPLGNALVFAGMAIALVTLSLLFRLRIPPAVAAATWSFLGVFTLLLPFDEIARWVAAFVALAVALQIARSFRMAPERWRRRVARATGIIVLAMIGFGLGQRGALSLRRAAAIRSLGPADASAPSVLLVIWDTVRRDELSLYGYDQPTTPALERWAERGVVFDQAITTAPWTLPSHGSLFTGELGDRLGGGWVKPISGAAPTLAERLRNRGYLTAGFAANLLYTSYESGLTRGFIDYRDYPISLTQIFLQCPLLQTDLAQALLRARSLSELREAVLEFSLHVDRLPADEYVPAGSITNGFLRWHARTGPRPFFAFLNYFDAHGPYRSPREFQARLAPGKRPRERYHAAIAYLDSELDRLFHTLESRGALERTIVVVTSDHGELFDEHGLKGHGNALYLPLLRVPLVLWYPGKAPAGAQVLDPVSLRDIPATILDLAGDTSVHRLPGRSLARSWTSPQDAEARSAAISQVMRSRDANPRLPNDRTGLQSILDDRYHYIRSGLGKEELYAWQTDSLELRNLAGDLGSSEILIRLRKRLARETGAAGGGSPPMTAPLPR